jgi:hypothetical protein
MKLREKIEKQLDLMHTIRQKANINIVTCGKCGAVNLHSLDDEEIQCAYCDFKSDPCDFPDYLYTGMELSAEFDEE